MERAWNISSHDDGYDSLDDRQLVKACLDDSAAFSALYRRYAGRVYWYLYSRTRSPDDAADLTQQVFIRCYQALPGYVPGRSPFTAWLFRIARNAAIDLHRSQRAGVSWDRLVAKARCRETNEPEAPVGDQELLTDLRGAILRMSPDKQELLALRFAAGLSISEIAMTTGKSEAATRKQLQRLLSNLKEYCDHD